MTGLVLSVQDLSLYGWLLARYAEYLAFTVINVAVIPFILALFRDPEGYPD